MRPLVDPATLVLVVLALVLTAVIVRVIPSLAFPVVAGWLVAVFYRE